MSTKTERLSRMTWWRISLAGLCLAGTLVGQNFGDWSTPVNLGPTFNAGSRDM